MVLRTAAGEEPKGATPDASHSAGGPASGLVRASSSMQTVRWWSFAVVDRHDVTALGVVIETQFNATRLKLPQHCLDASFDGRMVGAVACDEFLDGGPERRWRQTFVGGFASC